MCVQEETAKYDVTGLTSLVWKEWEKASIEYVVLNVLQSVKKILK